MGNCYLKHAKLIFATANGYPKLALNIIIEEHYSILYP